MSIQTLQMINLSINELTILISNCVKSELQNLNEVNRPKPETEILTREQTKDLLQTSYVSLWKYNRDGILKAKKIGSKVYYMRQDVLNLLNNVA
jgi:hypothetical protein